MEASDQLEPSSYFVQENLPLRQGKLWNEEDQQKTIKRISETLTEIVFQRSQLQMDLETARTHCLKRLEINLRRCFLKKFRFPMKLARGVFIRCTTPSGANIFLYEGFPFAVEKPGITVKQDDDTYCGTYFSNMEPVMEDMPLPNIIRTYNLAEEAHLSRYAFVNPKIF